MTAKQTNILIIDDDRVSQIYLGELISTVLPQSHVAKADSGEKALELIKNTKFDYIFSDIRMPGLSGETLFEQITKISRKCGNCQIYAISGASVNDSPNIKKAGAIAVLQKPVDKYLLEKLFYGNIKDNLDEKQSKQNNSQDIVNPQKIIHLYEQDYSKVAHILKLYNQTLPSQMTSLLDAWKIRNYEEVRSLGHSLKNSFTYLGADKLKEKAHSLENITEGRTEEKHIDSIVYDISTAARDIKNTIAELIDRYEKK